MFTLKSLSKSSIESALEKAERYRLLNEPEEAESICRDVIAVDPENQRALIMLALSLTDQFHISVSIHFREAREIVSTLQSEYDREYYSGIIDERRAKAARHRGTTGWGHVAYEWLCEAMTRFERAEKLQPPGNDDASLRWNSCARLIMTDPTIKREEHQANPIELE